MSWLVNNGNEFVSHSTPWLMYFMQEDAEPDIEFAEVPVRQFTVHTFSQVSYFGATHRASLKKDHSNEKTCIFM